MVTKTHSEIFQISLTHFLTKLYISNFNVVLKMFLNLQNNQPILTVVVAIKGFNKFVYLSLDNISKIVFALDCNICELLFWHFIPEQMSHSMQFVSNYKACTTRSFLTIIDYIKFENTIHAINKIHKRNSLGLISKRMILTITLHFNHIFIFIEKF